jgi:hypothetical protein
MRVLQVTEAYCHDLHEAYHKTQLRHPQPGSNDTPLYPYRVIVTPNDPNRVSHPTTAALRRHQLYRLEDLQALHCACEIALLSHLPTTFTLHTTNCEPYLHIAR